MSQVNPYAPLQQEPADVRSVAVRPLKLLKRSVLLMSDQYGTLLAATLVALLIGSVVPLGVLLGPMVVGLYLCFLERERGVSVEFATLFKGFDYFLESLVAMLLMVGVSFVVMLPVLGIFAIAVAVPLSAGGDPNVAPVLGPIIGGFYLVMILVHVAVYIPFAFVFQLIADRGMRAIPAVKASFRGALQNVCGVAWFLVCMTALALVSTLLCLFPVVFVLPVIAGASFLLYRDIFGSPTDGDLQ